MPLYGVGDVANAHREGRVHQAFFTRGGSSAASLQSGWIDTSMANGSTGYDVKVGDPLTFTPRIPTNNSGGIWIGPSLPAGMTRHIVNASVCFNMGGSNPYESLVFYDLLGYYPLIDGTLADTQTMDNTLTLPRYADGVGVMGVWVSHLAPTTANGTGTMTFIDHSGATRTANVRTTNAASGVGTVHTNAGTGSTGGNCIFQPLGSGSRGIRRLVDVTFATNQPGGFMCFMLVKPLFTMVSGGTQLAPNATQLATELCFTCQKGGLYPEVKDGAAVNFFAMHNGGTYTVGAHHGSLTFAWG